MLNKKGFSLIEIIIVIIILGIMASQTSFNVKKNVDHSKDKIAQTELMVLDLAVKQYIRDYFNDATFHPTSGSVVITNEMFNTLIARGYIDTKPTLFGNDNCNFYIVNNTSDKMEPYYIKLTGCTFLDGKEKTVLRHK